MVGTDCSPLRHQCICGGHGYILVNPMRARRDHIKYQVLSEKCAIPGLDQPTAIVDLGNHQRVVAGAGAGVSYVACAGHHEKYEVVKYFLKKLLT